MDGTLVDSTAVVERAWTWWAARHNLPLTEILSFSHGRPTESTLRQFRPGIDVTGEVEEMDRYEELEVEGILSIQGAALAVAAAQSGKWAVVTSAPRRLAESRLKAACLPLPSVLIPADEIERGKPDPEGFLKAAKRLNVAPGKCIVFEDTRPGIDAAESAGMFVIGMLTTFSKEQLGCNVVIRDFDDIRIERSGGEFLIEILNRQQHRGEQVD